MTHTCVSELTIIGPHTGLSTGLRHNLNQCWKSVNSILRNKPQWNLKQNSYIFIQENIFENLCEMMAILSRPQCVKRCVIANTTNMRLSCHFSYSLSKVISKTFDSSKHRLLLHNHIDNMEVMLSCSHAYDIGICHPSQKNKTHSLPVQVTGPL